jgi:hypothetical protein
VAAVLLGVALWMGALIEDRGLRVAFGVAIVITAAFYALREFGWHLRCPRCGQRSGRIELRAATPWRWFFNPRQACPGCGRPFVTPPSDYRLD